MVAKRLLVSALAVAVGLGWIGCGGGTSSHSGSGPSSASSAAADMPSNAIVLANLDDESGWPTCGNCANSGATGTASNQALTVGNVSPSEDGSSAKFAIAASQPYLDGYWWLDHSPVTSQINGLAYEFDIYVPEGFQSAPHAIEFECQQSVGGYTYNFAWQAAYVEGVWRVFDYAATRWDTATMVPFSKLTPGTWHHIKAEFHDDTSAHTVTHDALTIDGTRYAVGMVHDAPFTAKSDHFTNAFQLDTNRSGQAYHVFLDNMSLSYW